MNHATHQETYIYSRLVDDPDLQEIVGMFVEEMPERISKLLDQLETKDWDALRRTAHQLKGAAGSYGFDIVTTYAGKVEAAVRDKEPEQQIHDTVAELVDLCQRMRSGTGT
jgi:HPt (histidine-containing phosphotransfer) domain-containing protein